MTTLIKVMRHKNFFWRLSLLILSIFPVFYLKDFYYHFYVHFTGGLASNTITQQWHVVLLNILFFVSFLIPLSFRKKVDWKGYGLATAFFVSLFVEMYGIPFTLLFASKIFNTTSPAWPNQIASINFLGVHFGMTLAMVYGTLLMIIGMFLIMLGWVTLYKNIKKKGLVTEGIYSYSRHPQYFGFILITLGWFIGWPTILTAIFAPILIYKYVSVCKTEEEEVSQKFPSYKNYKKNVPFFI